MSYVCVFVTAFVFQIVDMPTCWAPGCTSGYRTSTDVGRHFFTIPADKIEQWARKIPSQGKLNAKHRLCDLHFDEHLSLIESQFHCPEIVGVCRLMLPLRYFRTCQIICHRKL